MKIFFWIMATINFMLGISIAISGGGSVGESRLTMNYYVISAIFLVGAGILGALEKLANNKK